MRRPNIILFMMDQLSAKWVEAAEQGIAELPNLARLKQMGTTFTNAITSNPVCLPARATLATGLTTRGHGVLENGYRLDPRLPTFMQVLQRSGWRTGAFGKLHFYPHYAGLSPDYRPFGFDVVHNTEDSRGGEWLNWVEQEHPEHYDSVLATIWASAIPEYSAYGNDGRDLRARIERIRPSFQWDTPEFPENTPESFSLPFPEQVSQTSWITGRALDFLRSLPSGQPFFAQVSYVQPHSPYCAPAEYIRAVDPNRLPEPVAPEWQTDPHAPGYFSDKQPAGGDWRHARRCYFADIAHLDHQLGLLLGALQSIGQLDSTYILLLSDHGDLLYDHGFVLKEERHYDACIRVPLVIAGPGLNGGGTCDAMVQLEDICPTILDIAGQSMPPMPKTGPYLHVDAADIPCLPGGSLLPFCHGEAPDGWREAAYVESYNPIWSVDPGDWARTVRTRRYRYTVYPGSGEQLFDLFDDPHEQHNLAASPGHAAVRGRLRDQLLEKIILQDYPKTRRDLFALGVH